MITVSIAYIYRIAQSFATYSLLKFVLALFSFSG